MTQMSHIGPDGAARMVDVTEKASTKRMARASGCIRMKQATLGAIRANQIAKGDVLSMAKVAGIMAAKRTAELIPLCHPLPLTDVELSVEFVEELPGLRVESVARTVGPTGVEMEAITAAVMALVTIYDMAKAIDREMTITEVCLLEKSGGRSGNWHRP